VNERALNRYYNKHSFYSVDHTNPEAMKIEQDPEMMQSAVEHQEIPMGEAVVIPVRGLRKWHSVCKLAVEHRQKPNERNQGFCGLWKRVTVADRRTSRHVRVAWRKRKLLRKSGTRENCGTACRNMSRHATVAWQQRNITRKIWIQVNSES
jgi:hypothetical protein